MGDDLFGQAQNEQIFDYGGGGGAEYDEPVPYDEEAEEKKRIEQREKKKEAFVNRYILEKQWYKEELIEQERQRVLEEQRMKIRMQQFTNADQKSILEKYEQEDQEDEFFKPVTKYNKGPTSERFLTNKQCIFVWIFLNAFFAFTAIYVLVDGRPIRLINGYDFRSEICGRDKHATRPYLYFANPVKDIRVGFCTETCPASSGSLVCLYDKEGVSYTTAYTKFCFVQMQANLRSRYCSPLEPINRAVVSTYLESFDLSVKRYASDVNLSLDAILCGILVTVLLSVLFSNLLRKNSTVTYFVIGIFFLTTMCFSVLAFLFYREYTLELEKNCFTLRDEKDCVGSRGYSYRILAFIVIVIAAIYVLTLSILSRRLYKIIGFLKIVSQVVEILTQLKWLPFYILVLAISVAGITLINIPFGLSVASVETVDSVDSAISGNRVKIMEFSGFAYFIAIYDFFIFITWMLFLLGFRDLYTSYCLSIWFFTKRKDTVEIPKMTIFKAILRYHIGTLAMYSLISTVITIPKTLIMLVRKSLRSLPQYMNPVRYFQSTCNMCLFAYEKFLRYFSKHSLVQVSITSKDFYPCSKIAYFLLFRNKHKISDMDQMQEFIVNNVKICCAFISGLVVYGVLSFVPITPILGNNTEEIENKLIPGIVMFIFSYFFSAIFQGSYDITCKTVIQCYLIDEEIHYGENRYVEPFIKNCFEYYVQEDIEKYKIQSKDGLTFDQEKARKAKQDVSDDDRSFQSEEFSDEDDKKSKKAPKDGDAKFETEAAAEKPEETRPARPVYVVPPKPAAPPATVAPVRLTSAQPKEQEMSLLKVNTDSEEDDSEEETKPQLKQSQQQLPQQPQKPSTASSFATKKTRVPTRNVGVKDYDSSFISGANQSNSSFYKPTVPKTFSYQANTASSQSKSTMLKPPTQTASPLNNSSTKFNFQTPSPNYYAKQDDKTATSKFSGPKSYNPQQQQQKTSNYLNDETQDLDDDFGFGNPFSQVPAGGANARTINLSRGPPQANNMRLLNASQLNTSKPGGRLGSGQSNHSGVQMLPKGGAKHTFDPFSQFEKDISDSDESDD